MAGMTAKDIEDLIKAISGSEYGKRTQQALAEAAGLDREKFAASVKDSAAGRAIQKQQLAQSAKQAAAELGFRRDELEFRKEDAVAERNWKTGEREGEQTWRTGEREGEQLFRTGERIGEQAWKSSESAIDRAWRTGERLGEQDWKSGENAEDRAIQKYDIDVRADIAAKDLAAKYKQLEIDQGKAKADAWFNQQQVRLHEDEIGLNYAKKVTEYASSPDKNYFRMLDYQAQPGAQAGRNYLAGLMNQQSQGFGTWGGTPETNSFTRDMADAGIDPNTMRSWTPMNEGNPVGWSDVDLTPPPVSSTSPTLGPPIRANATSGVPASAAAAAGVNVVHAPYSKFGPNWPDTLEQFQALPVEQKQALKQSIGMPPHTNFDAPVAGATGSLPSATTKPTATPTPAINRLPYKKYGPDWPDTVEGFQALPEEQKQALKTSAGLPPRTSFGAGMTTQAAPGASPALSGAPAPVPGTPGLSTQSTPNLSVTSSISSADNDLVNQRVAGGAQQPQINFVQYKKYSPDWPDTVEQFQALPDQQKQALKQSVGLPPHTSFGTPNTPMAGGAPGASGPHAAPASAVAALGGAAPYTRPPEAADFSRYQQPMGNYGDVAAALTNEGLQQQINQMIQNASNEVAQATVKAMRGADPNQRWAQGTAQVGLADRRAKINMLNAELQRRGLQPIPIPDYFGDPAYASDAVKAGLGHLRGFRHGNVPLPDWATMPAPTPGGTPGGGVGVPASAAEPLTHLPDRNTFIQQHGLAGWADADIDNLYEGARALDRGFGKLGGGQWEGLGEARQNMTMAAAQRLGYDPKLLEEDWQRSRFTQGSTRQA